MHYPRLFCPTDTSPTSDLSNRRSAVAAITEISDSWQSTAGIWHSQSARIKLEQCWLSSICKPISSSRMPSCCIGVFDVAVCILWHLPTASAPSSCFKTSFRGASAVTLMIRSIRSVRVPSWTVRDMDTAGMSRNRNCTYTWRICLHTDKVNSSGMGKRSQSGYLKLEKFRCSKQHNIYITWHRYGYSEL